MKVTPAWLSGIVSPIHFQLGEALEEVQKRYNVPPESMELFIKIGVATPNYPLYQTVENLASKVWLADVVTDSEGNQKVTIKPGIINPFTPN